MTKSKRYKRYSPEFKREALKRASEEGVTDVPRGPIRHTQAGLSPLRIRRERNGRQVSLPPWIRAQICNVIPFDLLGDEDST